MLEVNPWLELCEYLQYKQQRVAGRVLNICSALQGCKEALNMRHLSLSHSRLEWDKILPLTSRYSP